MPSNYIEVECPACKQLFEVEVVYEPADPNYGADADGHRGMYVSAYYSLPDDPPTYCPICTVDYEVADLTDNVNKQIEKSLEELNEEL